MTQVLFLPEQPLNLAIKQQILNTLKRTDIYIIPQYDTDKKVRTVQVRDVFDTVLVEYSHDTANKIYTSKSMGIVVAKMLWRKTIVKTRQHQNIFDVTEAIDAKHKKSKELFEAKSKMSPSESLAYQLLSKESQNARYD
ncbi:MAG: hypothetical protein J6S57_02150 [Alphaproteobacteria bacterium]|nr:hypothetical protein [Alphaproteobacteria bacterium]